MKKIYNLICAAVLVCTTINESNAQCISTTQYPSTTVAINAVPGSTTSVTTCNYGGEYSVDSFTATGAYVVTSSIATDYITVTDNANTPIAFGLTALNFTISTTGIYRIHVSASAPPTCGTQSSCRTIRVIRPQAPCSGVPTATTLANSTLLCPGAALNLSSSATYTGTGISYQWQSSTTGATGPFTAITTGTNATYSTPSASVTTWYQLVATCSNGPVTGTSTPVQVNPGLLQPTAAVTPTSLCSSNTANLSLTTPYTGVSYNWQSSSTGTVGSFSSIVGGSVTPFSVTGITSSTYYQAILTCTSNPSFSLTTQTVQVIAPASSVSTVPYFEGFETVSPPAWPNCSWIKTGDWATATTTLSDNRGPKTGVGYAYTAWSTISGGDMLYTGRIQLNAGITYSAEVSHKNDGANGWTRFAMLLASAQNTAAITNTIAAITSTTGITNMTYTPLTNTFVVATSGIYYVAFQVEGNGTPWYFCIDDISITIPCSLNTPTVTATGPASICSGNSAVFTSGGASTYSWSTGQNTSSISVTPTVTTSYTVTGTNIANCTNSAVATITVDASPVVSITGVNSVCLGNSTNLTASGATTYSWNTGATTASIVATPTANTTYTAIGTGTNGCVGMAMQTVTVNPLPTVNATTSNSVLCLGNTATLSATGASTYSWSGVGSGSSVAVSPTTTTVYTVTGTDANSCSNTAIITQTVSACTGIGELSKTASVMVYPNPATSDVTVFVSDLSSSTKVEIMDALGRVVLSAELKSTSSTISVSEFANGMYSYRIVNENGIVGFGKIVKE